MANKDVFVLIVVGLKCAYTEKLSNIVNNVAVLVFVIMVKKNLIVKNVMGLVFVSMELTSIIAKHVEVKVFVNMGK